MFFLVFSNANFQFDTEKLIWRSFTIVKALSISNQVELINKREFTKIRLNKNSKIFVMYVVVLEVGMLIYSLYIAQIVTLQ